jgi:hypothetical protein
MQKTKLAISPKYAAKIAIPIIKAKIVIPTEDVLKTFSENTKNNVCTI